ncbi:MAG: gephyrin-like molybdotransferase Glp [Bacteroidota bacterium]
MHFIEVEKAQALIVEHIVRGPAHQVNLLEALNSYTAETIIAPLDMPNFDNAAMDGYCFAFSDYVEGMDLQVRYTIQAGDTSQIRLQKGEAARIFTGAAIPVGADTVEMQEKVSEQEQKISIQNAAIQAGQHIRLQASQTKKGDILIQKNSFINAGVIGFLAAFGIDKIQVYKKPKIGILVTGNELISTNEMPQKGQIYESNSTSLLALLHEIKLFDNKVVLVKDDLVEISKQMDRLLQEVDILLISGGISVGDYDFVKEAMKKNEVQEVFYKIKQKPGKPIFFGIKENKRIFALPGNPASTYTCFHQYVKPLLLAYVGKDNIFRDSMMAIITHDYSKKAGLTHFLKAYTDSGNVQLENGQESYKMQAFSTANCLVELTADLSEIKAGTAVKIILI